MLAPESSNPPRADTTILIVDDEPQVLALVRNMLWKEGYTILDAHYGEEALRIAAQYPKPIHLLLTDIVMPEMNGYELADQLRAERPDLKVLYMSGYMDGAIREITGMSIAGAPLIRKPFTRHLLSTKISEILEEQDSPAPGRKQNF